MRLPGGRRDAHLMGLADETAPPLPGEAAGDLLLGVAAADGGVSPTPGGGPSCPSVRRVSPFPIHPGAGVALIGKGLSQPPDCAHGTEHDYGRCPGFAQECKTGAAVRPMRRDREGHAAQMRELSNRCFLACVQANLYAVGV